MVPATGPGRAHPARVDRREGQRRVDAVVKRSPGLSPRQVDQLGALLELVVRQPLE